MARGLQKIIIALFVLIFYGVVFAVPARAAVPIYVVGFDANTDFEKSLEQFLYNLKVAKEQFEFDLALNLAQREEDFTAAFALQKIEKAREDVNKLTQEAIDELYDYGWVHWDRADPRLGEETPIISHFKDTRIIHTPYDFLYEEPLEKARNFVQCYFNLLIWDQQGRFDEKPKKTFGKDTDESVKALELTMKRLLASYHRAHQYIEAGDQAFKALKYDNLPYAIDYCKIILNVLAGEDPTKQDPVFEHYNFTPEELKQYGFLPTLERNLVYAQDVSWMEQLKAGDMRNTLAGVATIAETIGERIITEAEAERALTYVAGQGLRPEKVYYAMWDRPFGIPIGGDQYYFDTEYVISPAVMLLQKMQATTQAQFDLAGQGFLNLSPELQATDDSNILEKYNLAFRAPQVYSAAEQVDPQSRVFVPDEYGVPGDKALQFSDTKIKNAAPDSVGGPQEFTSTLVPPHIGVLQPWLMPNPSFRTAVKDEAGGVGRLVGTDGAKGTGLPAPWEDKNLYVRLGTQSLGGDNAYDIQKYLVSKTGNLDKDNIGKGVLPGQDYALNDWFDSVLEMYAPTDQRSPAAGIIFGANAGGERAWKCHLVLWFARITKEGFTGFIYDVLGIGLPNPDEICAEP